MKNGRRGDTVLVAGSSGRLGRRLVRRLHAAGYRIRVLTRQPDRLAPLADCIDEIVQGDLTAGMDPAACDGAALVLSCASASTRLLDAEDETSFENVNHYGNVGLLRAALRAGVHKFIYVAPLGAERLAHTAYGGAHERFVQTLHRSPMPHTVVRATAGFEAVEEAMILLRAGHPWLFGESESRTNPIHEEDLADFCAGAVSDDRTELSVGGPRTLSRFEIARLARVALAHSPGRYGGRDTLARPVLRRTNRRIRDLLAFGSAISALDIVAPAFGRRDLAQHLTAVAASGRNVLAEVQTSWFGVPLRNLDVQPL